MKKTILLIMTCVMAVSVKAQVNIDSIVAHWAAMEVDSATVEVPEKISDKIQSVPARPGYVIMTIPDSLASNVRSLLRGNRKVVRDDSFVDLEEKVTYKGDTLPMVLKDLKLGRYDRGLFNFIFVPKGMWILGLTASYGKFSTADLQMFDVISDVDISAHALSIKPYFSYAFKNNVTAGLRLEYSNVVGNIDNFGLDIDEDMSFSLNDIGYRSQTYSAALLLTQYIGLTRLGRFGVFNEAQLKFSSGVSDFNRPFAGEIRTTHNNNFQASLTYSPGVCVYVMPQLSCNLSFGVFGFYINHTRQWENGEKTGSRTTSGANFRFNIFNISFGLAVHL